MKQEMLQLATTASELLPLVPTFSAVIIKFSRNFYKIKKVETIDKGFSHPEGIPDTEASFNESDNSILVPSGCRTLIEIEFPNGRTSQMIVIDYLARKGKTPIAYVDFDRGNTTLMKDGESKQIEIGIEAEFHHAPSLL